MNSQCFVQEIQDIDRKVLDKDYWGSFYEDLTIALYNTVLYGGDVAIDCGCHKGLHTFAMARNCRQNGKVYAIEAVPELMQLSKEYCKGFDNIVWIQKALKEIAGGDIDFYFFPNNEGMSGLVSRTDVEAVQLSVPVSTLDSEVNEHVALIKLDIEGAELLALKGAQQILLDSAPVVIFENGRADSASRFNYSKEDFFDFFKSVGYNLYFISGTPFLEELWDSALHPWQFLAVHPSNPRSVRALATAYHFTSCALTRY